MSEQLQLKFVCEPIVVRQPDGGVLVRPGKVEVAPEEIDGKEACRLLGWPRSTLNFIADKTDCLKWRWQTPNKGKRIYDRASILALREQLHDPELQELQKNCQNDQSCQG